MSTMLPLAAWRGAEEVAAAAAVLVRVADRVADREVCCGCSTGATTTGGGGASRRRKRRRRPPGQPWRRRGVGRHDGRGGLDRSGSGLHGNRGRDGRGLGGRRPPGPAGRRPQPCRRRRRGQRRPSHRTRRRGRPCRSVRSGVVTAGCTMATGHRGLGHSEPLDAFEVSCRVRAEVVPGRSANRSASPLGILRPGPEVVPRSCRRWCERTLGQWQDSAFCP